MTGSCRTDVHTSSASAAWRRCPSHVCTELSLNDRSRAVLRAEFDRSPTSTCCAQRREISQTSRRFGRSSSRVAGVRRTAGCQRLGATCARGHARALWPVGRLFERFRGRSGRLARGGHTVTLSSAGRRRVDSHQTFGRSLITSCRTPSPTYETEGRQIVGKPPAGTTTCARSTRTARCCRREDEAASTSTLGARTRSRTRDQARAAPLLPDTRS